MSEIPTQVVDAADAHDLGSFLLQTPTISRHTNFLFENGAVDMVGIRRPRISLAYGWDQVAAYSRKHAVHIDFDLPRDVVEYSEVVTYNIFCDTDNDSNLSRNFEIHGPPQSIPGRQYFGWRSHKDKQADPPDFTEKVDAHIYRTITAHQLASTSESFKQGATLGFGAIALATQLITFDKDTWAHSPGTIMYVPPFRPLESELFSRRIQSNSDTLKIMRDDYVHESIAADQIINPGVLYGLYAQLYPVQWLSLQPRQNIVEPL